MDLDHRFRPGSGGRVILLGDGTEIHNEAPDSHMFDNENEDNDLASQVDKYNKGNVNGTAQEVTESPSSVQTEKSDTLESQSKDTRVLPDKQSRNSEVNSK